MPSWRSVPCVLIVKWSWRVAASGGAWKKPIEFTQSELPLTVGWVLTMAPLRVKAPRASWKWAWRAAQLCSPMALSQPLRR